MSLTLGRAVVWGIPKVMHQIEGLPADAKEVLLRFREDDIGRCLVNTDIDQGYKQYVLWYPSGSTKVGPWALMETI